MILTMVFRSRLKKPDGGVILACRAVMRTGAAVMLGKDSIMGLSAYALVLMADGTEKRAENMEAGDMVADPVTGGSRRVRKIWQGPGVGMFRITAANGATLDLTEDHPVLCGGSASPVGNVAVGAPLGSRDGAVACTGAERLMGDFMVYDIVMEDGGDQALLLANGIVAGTGG